MNGFTFLSPRVVWTKMYVSLCCLDARMSLSCLDACALMSLSCLQCQQSVMSQHSRHLSYLNSRSVSASGICHVTTRATPHANLFWSWVFICVLKTECVKVKLLYSSEPWLPQTKRMMKRQSWRRGAGPLIWSRTKWSTSLPHHWMISRRVPIPMQSGVRGNGK